MEKEEILKALRKKDQAAKLERVSLFHWPSFMALINILTEERRGQDCSRAEGEEVAEGSRI